MTRVRVGIIGTGFGAKVVAPTFTAVGADVVEVVSPRDDAAVAALCGRADVDLVSIHSPPFLHVQHVEQACAAGHAVLCDKPFGRNAAEAQRMVDMARDAGVINLLNFEFRHEPARVQVKQLIDDGTIGALEHVLWTVHHAISRFPLRPYGWLFDRALGGGWVGAWGAHGVDTVRWLLGDITDVRARCRTIITERPDADGLMRSCDAEDTFTASLQTASGATASIDTTFAAAAAQPTRMTFFGSIGTIEIVSDRIITVRRSDGSKEEIELERRTGDQHAGALGGWLHAAVAAVRSGEQITPSFADGLACRQVLDAVLASP